MESIYSLKGRLSRPSYFDAGGLVGGLGVIPRRSLDLRTQEALRQASEKPIGDALLFLAQQVPYRLLRLLLATDGTANLAGMIEEALAFGPGKIQIVAVGPDGVIDDDGTAEIGRLWARYATAQAIGVSDEAEGDTTDQARLLLHIGQRINDTGQACLEGIPGRRGEGVAAIVDFDALTTRYRDDARSGRRFWEQQGYSAERRSEWYSLDSRTVVSASWRDSTDNPYGVARRAAALPYLLRKAARRADFADWFHAIAWPRVVVEVAISALFKIVAENPALLDTAGPDGERLEPDQWVARQFAAIRSKLESMKADDFWTIGEGKAYAINPSDFGPGTVEMLKMERLEEIQALGMLPALVGVTDGGTQAYSEVQWIAETVALALYMGVCSRPLVKLANLHFRLMGQNLRARAEIAPLPPIDRQKAEAARQALIETETLLAVMGLNSPDDLAVRLTDSSAADPAALEKYIAARRATAAAPPPTPAPAPTP